jgi:hypothetical protein
MATRLTIRQTKLADLVQIAPEDFSKRSIDAIEDNLNAKYSNKVRKYTFSYFYTFRANRHYHTGHPEDWPLHQSL